MTLDQLKKAAQNRFASHGFDGTSLAHIAEDVGIKKQSIYTYFKGKDELFLQVFSDAAENEWESTREFIGQYKTLPIEEFLYQFLLHQKERFERNTDTKFWLRISFFPPAHLYDKIMEKVYTYLDELEKLLVPIIRDAVEAKNLDPAIDAEQATVAFLGVLDSVFVEMLYGGPKRLEKRLDASWHFYWRGVSKD
ncbi:TetR/AcrR family transcriptional regulator [Planomicrobium sp. CPCC 101079]|uniref:TetR/AcrR family transcriptional regulator n=1 Tax=Planomicrobium sp. CPCC 101079 TaxID=2599618 RepID=UPI0011B78A1A|nr:TetR/AcrR family transcriptional regulator [Planomicrobium sp. CPCC 101079]TWT09002.1 TetR/AcrR family transcriptional regulator [Planomicrobium sp. CPCC 101079]